jgi:hypothetical protein
MAMARRGDREQHTLATLVQFKCQLRPSLELMVQVPPCPGHDTEEPPTPASARRFAANVRPIIEEIMRAGATSHNAIAAKLSDMAAPQQAKPRC